jgi:hypothetical protein
MADDLDQEARAFAVARRDAVAREETSDKPALRAIFTPRNVAHPTRATTFDRACERVLIATDDVGNFVALAVMLEMKSIAARGLAQREVRPRISKHFGMARHLRVPDVVRKIRVPARIECQFRILQAPAPACSIPAIMRCSRPADKAPIAPNYRHFTAKTEESPGPTGSRRRAPLP